MQVKKINLNSEFVLYNSKNELPPVVKSLMESAEKARNKAYAPYSNFLVGAAVHLENGKIITGNNQENAAYPSGICAERTAVFYASSKYPNQKILQMAIIAGPKNKPAFSPVPPCGSCRQVLAEYEIKQNNPIELYLMGTEGEVAYSKSIKNILPILFSGKML